MFTTLVDAPTLADHLNDGGWVILDCRFNLADKGAGREAYLAGHIPGAIYADLEEHLSDPVTPGSGRHPLPARERLVGTLSAWGVDETRQVVVYDDAGGSIAARAWWLLHWLGHHGVALLDGGIPAWERAGLPLATTVPMPTSRRFVDRHVETPPGADEIRQSPDALLVDARTAVRFRGEEEPIDPVAGRIPGAVNAPFDGNLNARGGFLPATVLRERFQALLGGSDPRSVIHYCGSGVTACHNLLAMEHAGMSGSRLYVGSWSEWIADPSREVETGPSSASGDRSRT